MSQHVYDDFYDDEDFYARAYGTQVATDKKSKNKNENAYSYNNYGSSYSYTSYGTEAKRNMTIDYKNFELSEKDFSLLESLYTIKSPSGHEQEITDWLIEYVSKFDNVEYTVDKVGNLLVTKGKLRKNQFYPCVVAHMDTVHSKIKGDVTVITGEFENKKEGTLIWCKTLNSRTQDYDDCGGAGDDKNGIFVCLKMLEKYPKIKLAFFVSEETGCIGSRGVDLKFFDNCSYVLQSDRRYGIDLITKYAGSKVCGEDFLAEVLPIAKKFGMKEESGMITDVLTMKDRGLDISVVNMSSGYYEPHSDDEYTILEELLNITNFCSDIIGTLPLSKRYVHKEDKPVYNYNKTTYQYPATTSKTSYASKDFEKDAAYWEKYFAEKYPPKATVLKKCECHDVNLYMNTIDPNCPICNEIIEKKSNVFCEKCNSEFSERTYTYNCPFCNNIKLKVYENI